MPTTETSAYSKHAIGRDILDGLAKCLGLVAGGGGPKQKVILCGHDRGARIIQRIAFDFEDYPLFDILGIVLGDIVPITVQFQSFANPVHAAATYHWLVPPARKGKQVRLLNERRSLLAAPYPIPETMIEKYGGPEWVGNCLTGWGGTSEKGRANFLGPTGVEVFKQHFIKPSVIAASCADYRAAAHIDAQLEAKDHEEGKRIKFQTLVVYSKKYLGSRYDVTAVWREYMSYKERLTTCGIEEVGHFCFEEDPMPCYVAITDWMREVLRLDM